MGQCGSSTTGVETDHVSPTMRKTTNKNTQQKKQKTAAVATAVARTFLSHPANPRNIRMTPVNRPIDKREEAAIRAIFASLDKDQSKDVSNDELSFIFSSTFGFDLDRLAIEHVAEYLRSNGATTTGQGTVANDTNAQKKTETLPDNAGALLRCYSPQQNDDEERRCYHHQEVTDREGKILTHEGNGEGGVGGGGHGGPSALPTTNPLSSRPRAAAAVKHVEVEDNSSGSGGRKREGEDGEGKGKGENNQKTAAVVGKIDVETFLAHWPALLSYCERMVAAVHNKPLVANPQHNGESFESLLGPFVDAGFGEGKVLKAPNRGEEMTGKKDDNAVNDGGKNDENGINAMHSLIDRITELCYEKGVLFRDAFFEPTLEHVAAHSTKRINFSRWARISQLSEAFAAAAITMASAPPETISSAEKRKTQLVDHMSLRMEQQKKKGRKKGNEMGCGDGDDASSFLTSMSGLGAQFSASAFSPVSPCMYIQGTRASDVINNNWSGSKNRYAAGIASLADRFDLLRHVIYPPRYNPAGIYGVRVNRGGEWFWIIVDDFIPIDANNVPLFLRSKTPNEIWPLIIDKAFAKIKGSYEKLHNSQQSLLVDPLALLAGLQPSTYLISASSSLVRHPLPPPPPLEAAASSSNEVKSEGEEKEEEKEKVAKEMASKGHNGTHSNNYTSVVAAADTFSERCTNAFGLIKAFMDLNWFLVASPSSTSSFSSVVVAAETTRQKEAPPPQLVLDNSYSILGYFEASSNDEENILRSTAASVVPSVIIRDPQSSIIRLVKCRSPWGRLEWRGKWSDTDANTWRKYPNLAKILLPTTPKLVVDQTETEKEKGADENDNGTDDEDDGTFWIQVEDLVPRFDILHCWGQFSQELVDVVNNKTKKKEKDGEDEGESGNSTCIGKTAMATTATTTTGNKV